MTNPVPHTNNLLLVLFSFLLLIPCKAWIPPCYSKPTRPKFFTPLSALSSYLENDLITIQINQSPSRLCVVLPSGLIHPLCQHEDDVETDLFLDPRESPIDASEDEVMREYGEGWYGQRPVPSLGGGPGYGAEADEVWSVEESLLETLREDGVEIPVLDVGISHGEKARGGALDY